MDQIIAKHVFASNGGSRTTTTKGPYEVNELSRGVFETTDGMFEIRCEGDDDWDKDWVVRPRDIRARQRPVMPLFHRLVDALEACEREREAYEHLA